MTATATRKEHRVIQRTFVPQAVRTDDLPDGVCGRLVGVGLVYEKPDAYDTIWATGCLEMTKRSKVSAGKVGLFAAGQMGHEYGVRSHVGVVRTLETRGNEEWVTADLFNTEDGRRTKEYLDAVLRAGGNTGLSIGAFIRRSEDQKDDRGMIVSVRFTEVELEEFTITPRPAVPGADIEAVRHEPAAMWTMFDALLSALPLHEVRARVARASGHSEDPDEHLTHAMASLDAAIARHERHMTGTEATDEASQRKMMDEMHAARDHLAAYMKMTQDRTVPTRTRVRKSGHSEDPGQAADGAASSTPAAPEAQSDDSHPAQSRVATEAERARALAAATLGIPFHVGEHQERPGQ